MSDDRRRKPYTWVTWITALLAGMDSCVWKAWYKSHFRYAKRHEDDNFDVDAWTRQHNAMTDARVTRLKADKTWTHIHVEDQNSFKLDGATVTLSGKPDIVAMNEREHYALVIDEKSGKVKDSDVWQVLIYLFALPMVWSTGWRIEGEVEYRGHTVPVPSGKLVAAKPRIVEMMRIIGNEAEPLRSPSTSECRFCDILACPDRMNVKAQEADASKFF